MNNLPLILNRIVTPKLEKVFRTKTTDYGQALLTKHKRDGYDCVLVWECHPYPADPILLRVEEEILLYGPFDASTETVTIEVDGETYRRERTVPVEWKPLKNLPEGLCHSLLEAMTELGVY